MQCCLRRCSALVCTVSVSFFNFACVLNSTHAGTNIHVTDVMRSFLDFLKSFREPNALDPLYPALLEEMLRTEQFNVNIDMQYLRRYDGELFDRAVRYPQELIPLFDMCVSEFIESEFPDVTLRRRCQVRIARVAGVADCRIGDGS